jgi:hypothetical protein
MPRRSAAFRLQKRWDGQQPERIHCVLISRRLSSVNAAFRTSYSWRAACSKRSGPRAMNLPAAVCRAPAERSGDGALRWLAKDRCQAPSAWRPPTPYRCHASLAPSPRLESPTVGTGAAWMSAKRFCRSNICTSFHYRTCTYHSSLAAVLLHAEPASQNQFSLPMGGGN